MVDNCSDVTEVSTETAKAEALMWKRKFETERALSKKKSTKRQKRIERKTAHLKVTDIPRCEHITEPQQYQVRNYVRKILWRNLKYWHQSVEQRVVKKAMKIVDRQKKEEREKYQDYTCAYIRQLLTTKRNNCLAALKRKVIRNIESKWIAERKYDYQLTKTTQHKTNQLHKYRIRIA
jgi:hypothetical protein